VRHESGFSPLALIPLSLGASETVLSARDTFSSGANNVLFANGPVKLHGMLRDMRMLLLLTSQKKQLVVLVGLGHTTVNSKDPTTCMRSQLWILTHCIPGFI
jgi:hypothetical protein